MEQDGMTVKTGSDSLFSEEVMSVVKNAHAHRKAWRETESTDAGEDTEIIPVIDVDAVSTGIISVLNDSIRDDSDDAAEDTIDDDSEDDSEDAASGVDSDNMSGYDALMLTGKQIDDIDLGDIVRDEHSVDAMGFQIFKMLEHELIPSLSDDDMSDTWVIMTDGDKHKYVTMAKLVVLAGILNKTD